ncbi:MAG TPA: lipase family protein [Pseudonocardiaceae bacterium]|jgi:hypothetical protein|nr:lipase family protein [Pseudonocardiaceae bacterium]
MFGRSAPVHRKRLAAAAVLAVATLTGLAVPASANTVSASANAATPSTSVPEVAYGAPGTLLAAQAVTDLDPSLVALGAHEWRVWYTSRSGLNNRPVIVSGMVIAPAGSAPAGGWPVIAWAHGTTGVADDCAPSATSDLAGQLPIVLPLLQQGYLITATDYEGLGTPGPHPYLIPTSEGRSVIDSVRAARDLVPQTSKRWAVFGASQGGQAAWATDELARTWGAGLDFLGAAAAAPAANIAPVTADVPNGLSETQKELFPLVLYALKLQHPQLRYSDYLSGEALADTPLIPVTCSVEYVFATLPAADFTPRSAAALQLIHRYLEENALPQRRESAPMFVAQGTADNVVEPAWNDAAVAAACRIGDVVQYTKYAGAPHPALPAAEVDIVTWLDSRFAGQSAPDNCSKG